jgi:hypothetical protein
MSVSTRVRYIKFASYNLECRTCQKSKLKAETYPNKFPCRIQDFNDSGQEKFTSHPGLLRPVSPYVTKYLHTENTWVGRERKTYSMNSSAIHTST